MKKIILIFLSAFLISNFISATTVTDGDIKTLQTLIKENNVDLATTILHAYNDDVASLSKLLSCAFNIAIENTHYDMTVLLIKYIKTVM
ncbi:hypothetical protein JKY79_03315 [Candidatus Babeliales bacterium]|nr:hypothetical protein [Candidatus Babeliales bacterium]